jgi:hypothetical protein
MIERITTITPTIVDGVVEVSPCASLGELIDWRAVQQFSFEEKRG